MTLIKQAKGHISHEHEHEFSFLGNDGYHTMNGYAAWKQRSLSLRSAIACTAENWSSTLMRWEDGG